MKITLDTRFNGSLGPVTLREAVQQLKAYDLTCTVRADAVEQKVTVFSDCVERGFTPLRSEIMAAYYMAERDATTEAFDRGLITEGELEQKRTLLMRQYLA
ncbi:hypothetical protein ACFFV7_23560 [Nonomuraea spiralis]|uniref:Uncharacterized protein n=1 Tax=Nonomuraea spiralis TaxID=46182 RepID=A0ABV5II19_9ACTN|nr:MULTISPECIES: hypothetical protein [Nonomuraea]RSN14251.1 hypothetical protein DMB42_06850 [Nonomuraea sp. WAC 01424]GGS96047.1 hypothetical protein GCM10010176_044920 [Nonomuraea spiralis]